MRDGTHTGEHSHVFDTASRVAERGTRLVTWITAAMMVVEISAGWRFNSMALLADGWHMSSHAIAIGLSALAYAVARRYAGEPRFAFGSWKIEVLAGYSSALLLLGVAAIMIFDSVERLVVPSPVRFQEAIPVALLGLAVNVVCAIVLGDAHKDDAHAHGEAHHRHDLNLRSAYLHVLADAATSVAAILGLVGGMLLGWNWLDPTMGIVGALLVAAWARGLLRDTGRVLLDAEMNHPLTAAIRRSIGAIGGAVQLTDLHLWRVGRGRFACILSLLSDWPHLTPAHVRQQLAQYGELVHLTVEINRPDAVPQ